MILKQILRKSQSKIRVQNCTVMPIHVVVEDGTWNPGIYFTTTFSLYKMFSREKMLYHPLMSKYAMRHLATGQLPRALSHDIVISWQCHFLQTCRLATVFVNDFVAFPLGGLKQKKMTLQTNKNETNLDFRMQLVKIDFGPT